MRTSFGFSVEQGGCITGGSEGSISPLARRVKTPGETSIVGMDVSSSIFQLEHKDLCQAVKLGFMRLHARLKTLRGLEFTRWLTACLFSRTPQKTLQTFDLSCGRRTCARSHLLCWGFSGANAYFSAGAFLFLIFESVRSSFIFISKYQYHISSFISIRCKNQWPGSCCDVIINIYIYIFVFNARQTSARDAVMALRRANQDQVHTEMPAQMQNPVTTSEESPSHFPDNVISLNAPLTFK